MKDIKHVDLVYQDLIRKALTEGNYKTNRTGVETISTFVAHYKIDISQGFPLLTTKKLDGYRWDSLIHEFLWYLSGEDHIRNLRTKTKIWDAWADKDGNLDTAYGRYWRRFPSAQKNSSTGLYEVTEVDQIAKVIELLKTKPNSDKMVVQAWEPGNAIHSKLPPCHYTFVFNVQGNKLNVQLTQRSGDIGLGIPFNIAAYSILDMVVAQETGFELGEFCHDIVDAHIYCGTKERGQFYKENLPELRERVRDAKGLEDYLKVKEWVDLNAPLEENKDGLKDHVPGLLLQLSREPRILPKLEIAKKPLDELKFEDFKLVNYDPHPGIKFAVAA